MSRLFHLLLRDSQTLRRTRSIRDNIPQRTDITILRKLTTPGTRYRLGRCKWSAPTGKGAHWLHHVTSDHDKMMIISKMLMLVKILWQDKSNIKALFTLLQILNIHQYESQIIYITTYPPTLCRWSWPRPWCGWNSGRPCHRAAFFVLPFFAVEGAVAFWAPGLSVAWCQISLIGFSPWNAGAVTAGELDLWACWLWAVWLVAGWLNNESKSPQKNKITFGPDSGRYHRTSVISQCNCHRTSTRLRFRKYNESYIFFSLKMMQA